MIPDEYIIAAKEGREKQALRDEIERLKKELESFRSTPPGFLPVDLLPVSEQITMWKTALDNR